MKISSHILVLVIIYSVSIWTTFCEDILENLPTPHVWRIRYWDLDKVTVLWRPLEGDERDRILGFKMLVWNDFRDIEAKYGRITNEKRQQPHIRKEIWDIVNKLPKFSPLAVIEVSANETSATYQGLEEGAHYQIRVQAFNDVGVGPYSDPASFS